MADVELRLTADTDGATKGVTDFRRKFEEMVRTIEKPLRQVNGLRDLEKSLEETGRKTLAARDRVRDLGNELARTVSPSRELNDTYKQAVNELRRLERAEDAARQGIISRRRELQAAGIDVRNLAAEQRRLRSEMAQATGGVRAEGAITSAMGDLGVSKYRALQSEIGRVRQQYELLKVSGRLTAAELNIAHRTMTQRIREQQLALRELNGLQARSAAGAGASSLIAQAGGAYAGVRALQGIVRVSDSWTELSDRIKLATGSQAEYENGMSRLRDISDRTFTDMKANSETFINSLSPLRERGFTNPEVLRFVEAVGLGMVASAAKGERAAASMQQFSNALADGKLQGDAFQSMLRNTPAIADALGVALGKTREELAKMATEGLLTTDVWVPALISQTENLGKAVDDMNIVVGDALTRLNNAWEAAISKADMKPLVESIEELTKVVGDPIIVENLVKIASAMVQLAAAAVKAGSGFANMGDELGYAAAKATGNIDKLSKLEKTLKEVNNAITGDSFLGSSTAAQLMKYFDPEGLKAWKKELEDEIAKFGADLNGMSLEAYKAQQEQQRKQKELDDQALKDQQNAADEKAAAKRKELADLNKLREAGVKAAADAVKKQAAAEKAALRDVEKVKSDRLKIEERYQQALNSLSGGVSSTFGDAQDLKASARQALVRGDISTAQAQAQAALKILTDLAAAGENTYGFAGFIKELQGIELAANDIEQSQADQKLADIRQKMADLEAEAKKLEGMPVSVTADEASIEAVRTQIQALIDSMQQKGIVLPVSIANPNLPADGAAAPSPGFAEGGWTGPGAKYKPAGVVHADEHVMPKRVVNEPGALSFLEQVRRNGFKNTMGRFPGYAEGGLVAPTRPLPSIPQPSQSLLDRAAGGGESLPNTVFQFPGGDSLPVYIPVSQRDNFGRLRRKFGGTNSN